MGTGVEMKRKLPFALVATVLSFLVLSACGNDPAALESKQSLTKGKGVAAILSVLARKKAPPAPTQADLAAAGQALESAGEPVLLVAFPKFGYTNLMSPYGRNGAVTTWAGATMQTVSLAGGMVVATRGFGNDLMAARAPEVGQIQRATGYFHRGYSYLDGADQRQFFEYDCTFASAGTEQIGFLGKAYVTRKVIESCEGAESSFHNTYWFDQSGVLRQSDQRVSPQLQFIRLQQIVN